MPPEYGRQTRDVVGVDSGALCFDLGNGLLHVECVSVGDDVEDQTKRAELFFLALPQSVANLAPITVIDFSRQLVAEFLPVQLYQDAPAELCIVDAVQDMQRLYQASELYEGFCEGGWPVSRLQDAHDAFSFQVAEFQGACKANEILPVFDNDACVDFTLCDIAQGAVICVFVRAPDSGTTDICQARTELVPQEGAGNDHGAKTRILVGHLVVPGDTAPLPEIPRVWPGMDGCLGNDEPQSICRGRLSFPPVLRDGQLCMRRYDLGVRGCERFCLDEILTDPGRPASPQDRMIVANDRLKSDVAALGNECCAQTDFEVANLRGSFTRVGEQAGDLVALCLAQTICDTRPRPGCGAVSYAPNKPFQYRKARQNDVVRYQPVRGLQDQRSRRVVAHPAFQIEPSGQPHSQLWGIGKINEPVSFTDGANVPFNGLGGAETGIQGNLRINGTLGSQVVYDDRGHVLLRRRKSADVSDTGRQHRISKPVLGRPKIADHARVRPIRREDLRQIVFGNRRRQSTRLRPLRGRQKTGGHSVRNSQVLRRISVARKTKDNFFAKHICETGYFCNMIRTHPGAAA